jgi:hypothetical protein
MRLNKPPNKILGLSAGCALFVFSGPAMAAGALEAGISPITIGSPSSSSSSSSSSSTASTSGGAFSGMGVEIQLDYFINNSPWGLSVGALSEGGGNLESLRGRFYFLGHAQPAPPPGEEEKTGTVVLQPKTRGAYVEAGVGIFQITQTVSSTAQTGSQTTAGTGGLAAVGFEQPLFSSFYVDFRATAFSSFGSYSLNPVFAEVLVGVPFAF